MSALRVSVKCQRQLVDYQDGGRLRLVYEMTPLPLDPWMPPHFHYDPK